MAKKEKDFIFICRKCGHNLYIEKTGVQKLFKEDCPNCGEEPDDLWILSGEGVYK